MHFPNRFYRLPMTFDHTKLMEEVNQFDENEWIRHPNGFAGNSALTLISTFGEDNHDTHGAMLETPRLAKMPYFRQVMASFNTVIGRARLMRLAPHSKVKQHTDISLYWRHRMRLHIPLVTHENVHFYCEKQAVHMAAGEAWTFDNWRYHEVHNESDITRIHLVIDTVGTPDLWEILENESFIPQTNFEQPDSTFQSKYSIYAPEENTKILLESFNLNGVIPPADVDMIINDFLYDLNTESLGTKKSLLVQEVLTRIKRGWRALWSAHGDNEASKMIFKQFLNVELNKLSNIQPEPTLKTNDTIVKNGLDLQLSATLVAQQNTSLKMGIPTNNDKEMGTLLNNNTINKVEKPIFLIANDNSLEAFQAIFKILQRNQLIWSVDYKQHKALFNEPDYNNVQKSDFINTLLSISSHSIHGVFDEQVFNESIRLLSTVPNTPKLIKKLNTIYPDAKFILIKDDSSTTMSDVDLTFQALPNSQCLTISPHNFFINKKGGILVLCNFCEIPYGEKMQSLTPKQ